MEIIIKYPELVHDLKRNVAGLSLVCSVALAPSDSAGGRGMGLQERLGEREKEHAKLCILAPAEVPEGSKVLDEAWISPVHLSYGKCPLDHHQHRLQGSTPCWLRRPLPHGVGLVS